jgi:hypothetical protein
LSVIGVGLTAIGLTALNLLLPSQSQANPQPAPGIQQPNADRQADRQSELWWTKEQLEWELQSTKLIGRWTILPEVPDNPAPPTIEVTVNFQVWSLLDYFSRYEFANTFGLKAYQLGYQLRIVTDRGLLLGQYQCLGERQVPQCQVKLDTIGERGLRNRSPF